MNLRFKILLLPLLTVSITVLGSYFFVERTLQKTLENRIEAELLRTAKSVVETLHSIDLTKGTDILDKIADQIGGATLSRVSIFNHRGVLLGDSHILLSSLKMLTQPSDTPEIKDALTYGKGISHRFSSVSQQDELFVTILDNHSVEPASEHKSHESTPDDDMDNEGYIARVSISYEEINRAIVQQRLIFIIVGLITLIFSLLMGFYGAVVINRQVELEVSLMKKELSQRTIEMSLLHTLSNFLGTCTTLDEAGDVIKQLLPKLLPGLDGAIYIIRSSRNQLYLQVSWGGDWAAEKSYNSNECWALRKGRKHTSFHNKIHLPCLHMKQVPEKNYMCIPLVAQGDALGVMHVLIPSELHHTIEDSLPLSIAENIGMAVANLQLRESLQQQAIKDPLTGLYNRRYLTEVLEQNIHRSKRLNTKLALCMIDLDNFKKYNDTFGHDAGDLVLKSIAKIFKQGVRVDDTISRYGGEEFCMLLPDISRPEIERIMDKFSDKIKDTELYCDQERLPAVTFSAGVAIYPINGETAAELIKQADSFLYSAKRMGKDQVSFSSDD